MTYGRMTKACGSARAVAALVVAVTLASLLPESSHAGSRLFAAFPTPIWVHERAGDQDVSQWIINGQPADDGEYPAHAALFGRVPGGFAPICGATLVASRTVMTAAHCVTESGVQTSPADLLIALGRRKLSEVTSADIHAVASVDVHPGFSPVTGTNDVAMLTLAAPAQLASPNIEPVRVVRADEPAVWAPGAIATIVGWGDTNPGPPSAPSDVLLEANVPIRPDSACMSAYGADFVPTTMFCAGAADPDTGSADACQGDSGGPLLAPSDPAFALAGVISWGEGCNEEGFPGVYTRIGSNPLNAWVYERLPTAAFVVSANPQTGLPATFTSTSHPDFTSFRWDLDADGDFDDATGMAASQTYSTGGTRRVGLEATTAWGHRSTAHQDIAVAVPPSQPPSPPRGDTTAPETRITRGPRATTRARIATFRFRSNERGSLFQCRLERGPWRRCRSPRAYTGLSVGRHTFRVRARDAAGNVDRTPAVRRWRIRAR
ncbi:MAG TPA: serine protease [Gaiellaceae bacterium]|nr:serine protease [Gaiellaceae bacterium]